MSHKKKTFPCIIPWRWTPKDIRALTTMSFDEWQNFLEHCPSQKLTFFQLSAICGVNHKSIPFSQTFITGGSLEEIHNVDAFCLGSTGCCNHFTILYIFSNHLFRLVLAAFGFHIQVFILTLPSYRTCRFLLTFALLGYHTSISRFFSSSRGSGFRLSRST